MSKKTTLERVYLHINNGGLTFSIIERLDVHKDCIVLPADWHTGAKDSGPTLTEEGPGLQSIEAKLKALPREDRYNRRWSFRIDTHHFGATTSYSFPIIPLTVKWMISALKRVLARMEAPHAEPTDGLEYAFKHQKSVHVTAQDGQQVDLYWPVPREAAVGGSTGESSDKS